MALDLLFHVREQSDRFAAVLRDVDPSARVPSCPDWSADDLLWHLAEVHHVWATIVGDRIVDADGEPQGPDRPSTRAELFASYERATDALVEALAAASDDTPVWTWAADQNVGFVRRFQAHEALMHRVDAELAAGALTPLPTDLADDGIDVVLRYSMTWRPEWSTWTPSGAVGLVHATDTGSQRFVGLGEWSGHSPDTGKTYDPQPALELLTAGTPTFTVHAPAADLDAYLWNRPGFGDVTSDGDPVHIARFSALVENGVQ